MLFYRDNNYFYRHSKIGAKCTDVFLLFACSNRFVEHFPCVASEFSSKKWSVIFSNRLIKFTWLSKSSVKCVTFNYWSLLCELHYRSHLQVDLLSSVWSDHLWCENLHLFNNLLFLLRNPMRYMLCWALKKMHIAFKWQTPISI